MYQVGDYVIKTNKGVCRVEAVSNLDIPGSDKDKLYYTLVPIGNEKAKIFVPTEPEPSTVRKTMTKEEAWELIQALPEVETIVVTNEKFLADQYKECLKDKNPKRLASLIKTVYSRDRERTAAGKKLTSVDERYFKLADEYLNTELALALGIAKEDIPQLIAEKIKE